MKKLLLSVLALTLSCTAFGAGIAVGPLKDDSVIDIGCTFQHPSQKNKVMAFTDFEYKNLWINLGGKDVQFQGVMMSKPDLSSAGLKRYTKKFKNGSQNVEITHIVMSDCKTENCESSDVKATFKINDGKETKSIQTQGSCGA